MYEPGRISIYQNSLDLIKKQNDFLQKKEMTDNGGSSIYEVKTRNKKVEMRKRNQICFFQRIRIFEMNISEIHIFRKYRLKNDIP